MSKIMSAVVEPSCASDNVYCLTAVLSMYVAYVAVLLLLASPCSLLIVIASVLGSVHCSCSVHSAWWHVSIVILL